MIPSARPMAAVSHCFDAGEKSCLGWNHVARNELSNADSGGE
jgi:hypothetical protein